MLANTEPRRLFIIVSILLLRAVAPCSITFCCARLLGWTPRLTSSYRQALDTAAYSEALFFIFVYLPRRWLFDRPAPIFNPIPSRAERRILFAKTWDATRDVRRYLSLWFYGIPIEALCREDIKEFILWRMWNKTKRALEDEEELEEYLAYVEASLNHKFPSGKDITPSMMITFEPLQVMHRPLVWYLVFVCGAELQCWATMVYYGFKHYRPSSRMLLRTFPIRFLSMVSTRRSPADHIPYWYHPHSSKDRVPILFIHGIGVGLHFYLRFLKQYLEAMPEVGLIAVEILAVSSRMTPPMLRGSAMAEEISRILKSHSWDRVIVVSHSYGSVVASYLLRDPQTSHMVDHLLFVDPVSFSFHTPDVPYNFLRRQPKSASEIQLHYFASMDLDVARSLTRTFIWPENSLWREEFEHRMSSSGERRLKTTVAISGRDIITETVDLGRYLTRKPGNKKWYHEKDVVNDKWMQQPWSQHGDLEVLWFAELNHSEAFELELHCQIMVSVLQAYSRNTVENQHTVETCTEISIESDSPLPD